MPRTDLILENESYIFDDAHYNISAIICQRRIVDGRTINVNASFVVYLLQGGPVNLRFPGWLCGGAIVDRWFILTAAACLEDVDLIYVVAGYEKYVNSFVMDDDECISKTRKRIISWCHQSKYVLGDPDQKDDWNKSRIWANMDIALARVHEPFNFKDPLYIQHCSYLPSMITVGTGALHKMPGAVVTAYGWGHKKYFRAQGITRDYNTERLYYVSTKIMNLNECMSMFPYEFTKENIKHHCICTSGNGYLDDAGDIANLLDVPHIQCDDENDHGGPLVMWVGGIRYVVGVASHFRIFMDYRCTSPYVFTSTVCVSKFLMCILSRTRRFDDCAVEHGVNIVDKEPKWDEYNKMTTVTEKQETRTPSKPSTKMKKYPDLLTTSQKTNKTIRVRKKSTEKGIFSNTDTRHDSTEELLEALPDSKKRTSTEELLDLYE